MIAVRAFPDAVTPDVEGYDQGPGGGLFEVDDYSFDIEQVLSIGSQSTGAGAGKVTFNPFSVSGRRRSFAPGTLEMLSGTPLQG